MIKLLNRFLDFLNFNIDKRRTIENKNTWSDLLTDKECEEYALSQTNKDRLDFIVQKILDFKQKNNQKIINLLEIGAWAGFSAIRFSKIPGIKVITVDPWEVYTEISQNKNFYPKDGTRFKMKKAIEKNKIVRFFKKNIQNSDNISFIRERSENVFKLFKENYFDIIYIDGDHSYNSVYNDIKGALKIIKKPGLICGDDLEKQVFELDKTFLDKESIDFIDYKNFDYSMPPSHSFKSKKINFHIGVTFAVYDTLGKVESKNGAWTKEII